MGIFSRIRNRGQKVAAPTRPKHLALGHAADFQYCKRLAAGNAETRTEDRAVDLARLNQSMAFVPAGTTQLEAIQVNGEPVSPGEIVALESYYIDRFPVTNAEFSHFVSSGIYDDVEKWPAEIWQYLLQFVDQTGLPGPRFWRGGMPPRERMDHPVTGISWYEAVAYATWAGKRIPTAVQWQRAASWHTSENGQQTACSYPWGNSFDSTKANTWSSRIGTTVGVRQFPDGCTPNGVCHLIGNVWEWIDQAFVIPWNQNHLLHDYAEVRGGAYDTYFESQARCQFRSGQPLLLRGPNVGFRCCIKRSDLALDSGTH